jgi:hypothetical protein
METQPIMRTRKVIALSLLSAGAAVLFGGCPSQPNEPCVVARTGAIAFEGAPGNPYAVNYFFLNEAPGSDCTAAAAANPNIGLWPAGDFTGAVFAEAYGPVTAVNKLVGFIPEEFGWTNSWGNTNGLLDYVECTPTNNSLYAANGLPPCTDDPIIFGNFTDVRADSNEICTITDTDAGTQLINGVQVTYNFTKTSVYTAAYGGEGTQMQASVTITRQTAGPTGPTGPACVRNYTAIGLWPTTVCNVDNDCNPFPQPSNNPPRPLGSGVLPGVPVVCNLAFVGLDPVIVPNNIPQVPFLPCTISAPDPVTGKTTDSCVADGAPGTACSDLSADGGSGICAVPILDAVGCGDGVFDGGTPFLILTGNCAGGAHDNNGTGGTSMCFFSGPGPTTFPYFINSTN